MDDKPQMMVLDRDDMTTLETVGARIQDGRAVLPFVYHTKAGVKVTFTYEEEK